MRTAPVALRSAMSSPAVVARVGHGRAAGTLMRGLGRNPPRPSGTDADRARAAARTEPRYMPSVLNGIATRALPVHRDQPAASRTADLDQRLHDRRRGRLSSV